MDKEIFIGIDNGVTGSIGIITLHGATKSSAFIATPIFKERNYTIKEGSLNRIKVDELIKNLPQGGIVYLERPLVNPKAFIATESALRSLEATLVVLELLGYKRDKTYFFIDSKSWQKEFISSAVIGHDEMKEASKQIALKLFPSNGNFITKHGDGDGLLIAEYLFRQQSR